MTEDGISQPAMSRLSTPILLVRGDIVTGVSLQIADGCHRVCASYHTDENTDIPVILARLTHQQ